MRRLSRNFVALFSFIALVFAMALPALAQHDDRRDWRGGHGFEQGRRFEDRRHFGYPDRFGYGPGPIFAPMPFVVTRYEPTVVRMQCANGTTVIARGQNMGYLINKANQYCAQQDVNYIQDNNINWNNAPREEAYCREYQREVTVGGRKQQSYGRACRQEDGSWKIQN